MKHTDTITGILLHMILKANEHRSAGQEIPGVQLINGDTIPYPQHHRKVAIDGWMSKAFALYMSRFDQVEQSNL